MNVSMSQLSAQIFSGVAYGSLYGLFALSIVFLYRANRLFNFAATELATFFTICMFLLLKRTSYINSFLITIILTFFGGVALHFGLMRGVTERKNVSRSNETVVTIGLFTILNSISGYIFSDEAERFPSPLPQSVFTIGGISLPSHTLIILGSSGLIVMLLFSFLKFTKMGLMMEATADNMLGARLRGIKVSNVLALAWGMTTVISVIAGILIAPVLFLSPSMLTHVFGYALISVVIGGLESPLGAIVGGILVGVVENLATNLGFIGSELKFVAVFFFLLLVLVIKPRGIWGREERRRV